MVLTYMKTERTEKPDLRALFMILSLEGVDVSSQYLPLEEPRSCFSF